MPRRLALVADDCHLTLALHAAALQRAGFLAVAVASASAAVDEVRRAVTAGDRRFDLILLDYDMPEGDGLPGGEVAGGGPAGARLIRVLDPGRRHAVRMLCVSSLPLAEIEAGCLVAGFDGVLSKPLALDVLLGRLA